MMKILDKRVATKPLALVAAMLVSQMKFSCILTPKTRILLFDLSLSHFVVSE